MHLKIYQILKNHITNQAQTIQNLWLIIGASSPQQQFDQNGVKNATITKSSMQKRLKYLLTERGIYGVRFLHKMFRCLDKDQSGILDQQDFRWGLQSGKIFVTEQQMLHLIKVYSNNKGISYLQLYIYFLIFSFKLNNPKINDFKYNFEYQKSSQKYENFLTLLIQQLIQYKIEKILQRENLFPTQISQEQQQITKTIINNKNSNKQQKKILKRNIMKSLSSFCIFLNCLLNAQGKR